jgi:hypothetical protein
VRRALAILVLLALTLGVLAANRPSAHAATTCAKHTKRVVKHVKRHGKRTKVVRHKSYWTCEEVATPAPAPSSPAPAPSSAPVGAPPDVAPPAEAPVVTPPPEPTRSGSPQTIAAG